MLNIVRKANEIYRRHGADDLYFVATKLGTQIYESLDTENLQEVYFPDLKAIVIKPDLPFYQRSYLLAHALGHHLFHRKGLHRDYVQSHISGTLGSLELGRIEILRKEREADLFAGYLLIPEAQLKGILKEEWAMESCDLTWELALEFQVPKELVQKRLEYERMRRESKNI